MSDALEVLVLRRCAALRSCCAHVGAYDTDASRTRNPPKAGVGMRLRGESALRHLPRGMGMTQRAPEARRDG